MSTHLHQGDVIYLDFSGSIGYEIQGIRPAVVISSDNYNRNSKYVMVAPVTSHGSDFHSYVNLVGYNNVHGRVNASQIHCFSLERVRSTPIDQLRVNDFNKIISKVRDIMLKQA